MKCNKCGTDNPQGKNVCTKCGNFLYSHTPNNRQPMTPELKKQRRKNLAKAGTRSCLYGIAVMVVMTIIHAIISWLMVRFLFTDDMFNTVNDAITTTTTALGS